MPSSTWTGGGNSHMQDINLVTNFAKVNKTVNNPRVVQFAAKTYVLGRAALRISNRADWIPGNVQESSLPLTLLS